MRERVRHLIVRSMFAAIIAWLLMSVPLAEIAPRTWFAFVQVPVVIFLLVCYIGKSLIDTFYYDHFQS